MSDASNQARRALIAPCLALLLLTLNLSACTRPAGVIFETLPQPVVWPDPPAQPRIFYVGQLSTSADLKPAKPFTEGLREFFAGKAPIWGMINPAAVESDDQHRVFVADSGGRVVHVFDLEKRIYQQWIPEPPAAFVTPVGLAHDPGGRLFVADSAAHTIWVFDSSGKPIDQWGTNHLIRPCGMAWDATQEQLFVADAGAHQVLIFNHNGLLSRRFGSRGTQLGSFNFPTDVAIDHHDRVYVSDSLNCRVQQFSPDLKPIRQIGSLGDMPGYFSRPKGIAIDSEDHLYVIDAQFEAVQVYSSDGTLLMALGQEGRGPGEFWLPLGICIDTDDRIWIADTYNRRVQVFDYRSPGQARVPGTTSEAQP